MGLKQAKGITKTDLRLPSKAGPAHSRPKEASGSVISDVGKNRAIGKIK